MDRFQLIRDRVVAMKQEVVIGGGTSMVKPRLEDVDLEIIEQTVKSRVESGEHTDKSTADFINEKDLLHGKKVHWSKVYQIRKALGIGGRGKVSKQRSKKSRGTGAWAQPTGETATILTPETVNDSIERITLADIRAALAEAQRLVDRFSLQVRREFGE